MHDYLMGCKKYFGGEQRFQVCAADKAEAMRLGVEYVRKDSNYIQESLHVIRKMKPSFGGSND